MSAAPAGAPGGQQAPERPRHQPGSLAARLWAALVAFLLLITGAGLLVYLGVKEQEGATRTVVSQLQPLQVANERLRADFANSQAALHAYIDTREPRFLTFYTRARGAVSTALSDAARLASGAELRDVASQLRAAAVWYRYADRMRMLSGGSAALTRLTNESSLPSRAFYNANDRQRARLRTSIRAATSAGQAALDRAALFGGVLAGVAVAVAVAVAAGTARSIVAPLQGLTAALRRLTSGDYSARVAVAGPAETREAAISLNALAGEVARLRAQEAEHRRLSSLARIAGLRIREHLQADEVLSEARAVIEHELDCDAAYLHLLEDGRVGPPLAHEHDWVMPPTFLDLLGPEFVAMMTGLYPRHGALVVQDFLGPDGALIPAEIREPMVHAGLRSQVLAPFGVGADMLGFIVVSRRGGGHPWTPSEVDAVESIATDLGRGLHHARMYEAENKLVTELREIDRLKSDFLATVSHELRTPLTSIAGFVELLRDEEAGALTREQREMLETVDRNTARLRHLIEDVLTLSKIESRAFRTTMRPVNLAEVATAAVAALQPQAGAHGLTLTLEPAGSLMVSGDPGQLDRMLMNLLSNAVKFTPSGGQVTVSLASEDDLAVLTVRDTGIGIPGREQKELFTRFFRASNATERSIPGTGLGLTIVQAIVGNHHGCLSVHSREGEGTTVAARIPLLTGRAAAAPGEAS